MRPLNILPFNCAAPANTTERSRSPWERSAYWDSHCQEARQRESVPVQQQALTAGINADCKSLLGALVPVRRGSGRWPLAVCVAFWDLGPHPTFPCSRSTRACATSRRKSSHCSLSSVTSFQPRCRSVRSSSQAAFVSRDAKRPSVSQGWNNVFSSCVLSRAAPVLILVRSTNGPFVSRRIRFEMRGRFRDEEKSNDHHEYGTPEHRPRKPGRW